MRHLPTKEYSGLTIVLSNPSRQDSQVLLSGAAGVMFNQDCLLPATNRWRCDIRTADTLNENLLLNTTGILLLGESALKTWTTGYDGYTINELRGTPLNNKWGLPCLCSNLPQDAVDMVDHESRLNPHLQGRDTGAESGGDEEDSKFRHGKTRRHNYRFWLQRDTQKILYRMGNPPTLPVFSVKIFPQADEIIKVLSSTRGQDLFFDIETDGDYNITCFGFSFGDSSIVYSVPILRYDYSLAYGRTTYKIIWSLCLALCRNIAVIHNSSFDLFILAWKYRLLFGRHIYDTMLAQHRCFPEAEKSLGHCLSAWEAIWMPTHKDEGIFQPHNVDQEMQLWNYNAKDVIGMRYIKNEQLLYAAKTPGLEDSIRQSNSCIYSFLVNTLLGINIDVQKRSDMIAENDKLMTQYLRAVRMLVGPGIDLLPSSSKSCVRYFHDIMGYPVVGRSKKTGDASLDETNLLKLKLKQENPVIDFCIKYRQTLKETGSLNFEPLNIHT